MPLAPLSRHVPAGAIVLLGGAIAAIAATYPLGSLLRPGPGFFPLVIGLLLAALGLALMIETWRGDPDMTEADDDSGAEAGFAWRPLIWTCAGILAFSQLLERAGLIPATFALILLAALGEAQRRWGPVLAVCMFMAGFGTALFVWGLGVPVEAIGPS